MGLIDIKGRKLPPPDSTLLALTGACLSLDSVLLPPVCPGCLVPLLFFCVLKINSLNIANIVRTQIFPCLD